MGRRQVPRQPVRAGGRASGGGDRPRRPARRSRPCRASGTPRPARAGSARTRRRHRPPPGPADGAGSRPPASATSPARPARRRTRRSTRRRRSGPGRRSASTGEYVCEVTPCRLPIDSSPAGSGTRNSPNSRAQWPPSRSTVAPGPTGSSQAGANARSRTSGRSPALAMTACLRTASWSVEVSITRVMRRCPVVSVAAGAQGVGRAVDAHLEVVGPDQPSADQPVAVVDDQVGASGVPGAERGQLRRQPVGCGLEAVTVGRCPVADRLRTPVLQHRATGRVGEGDDVAPGRRGQRPGLRLAAGGDGRVGHDRLRVGSRW